MTALARLARVAIAALIFAVAGAPVFAGPAQTAVLSAYVGVWTGKGVLTGAETGTLSCKLTFKANGAKVNYSGRCNATDMGSQSFSGSLSYNESKKRYESRSQGQTVVGTESGGVLSFSTKSKTMRGTGTSVMSLGPSSIVINSTLTTTKGETTNSTLTFKKN